MHNYDQLLEFFEFELNKITYAGKPIELYNPIKYTLGFGGKRIRPVTTLMACELFNNDFTIALPQALAIEMFHNFTLIHDDIMDNAPIRRGKETVFKKWNSDIAILSGDTLFALAYQNAQNAHKDILPETLGVFNKTAIEVCEGQQFDLNYENNNNVSVDEYMNMIRLKTAVLFGASLKIGALIGGAKKQDADLIYDFGLNIGLGFQLKDDLLDTFGNEEVFGKKTGGDIITNKKTFLYLKSMELADESLKIKLKNLYNSPDINDQEKIDSTKEIFSSLKIEEFTSREIDKYYAKGISSLKNINVPDENKKCLKELAIKMIDRTK